MDPSLGLLRRRYYTLIMFYVLLLAYLTVESKELLQLTILLVYVLNTYPKLPVISICMIISNVSTMPPKNQITFWVKNRLDRDVINKRELYI